MKINFVVAGIYKSGGMKVIFKYASELSKKGHDVVLYRRLIPYNYMRGKSSLIQVVGLYCHKLKNLFLKSLTIKPDSKFPVKIKSVPLVNNLFLRNADATIATEWVTAYSVDKLSNKKGNKFYFIQGYENWNNNVSLVDESYELKMNRITVSKSLSNFLLNEFNASSQVIMNGIDYDEFYHGGEQKNNDVLTISFINHHLKYKNSNIALSVVDQLRKKYDNIKIICFGTDKTDLPGYITYYENPSVKTIREIYCSSDIFLFTSSSEEGFGLPPAEAMACRCAVVATKVGAIPDYSIHLENAIHVDKPDPVLFLERVEYLINNKSEIIRIANNAYESIRRTLFWEKSVSQFEKILQ